VAGVDLITRPVFADLNCPVEESRRTLLLLVLFWHKVLLTLVVLRPDFNDFDLELLTVFAVLADLVVAFLAINFSPLAYSY
jgi:hypothetical protein